MQMKLSFKKSWTVFLTVLALTFSAIGVTPAHAAALVVNSLLDTAIASDGNCTLREAINNANADSDTTVGDCVAGSGADTIGFAANYTITLGSQLPAVTSNITINGTGAAYTIIQANALPNTATYRILEVSPAGNLSLNNLKVQNGRCNGSCTYSPSYGGGILNRGTLTVTGSILSYNYGDSAAGINNYGTLTVTNSTFSGNVAAGDGGGIYNWNGTLTVTNSTFSGNSAQNGGGIANSLGTLIVQTNSTFSGNVAANNGGGIFNDNNGTLNVTGATFTGNSAPSSYGGGIFNNDGTLNVTDSVLSGNFATGGGGICNNVNGILTVTGTTFSGNSATSANGGGIYNDSHLTNNVTSSTFSGNTAASGSGGGIFNSTGRVLTVTGSTFNSNNTAINGGGIFNSAGTLTVTSSILDGNSATYEGGGICNPGGTLTVTNSTLSNNPAGYHGGGIFSDGGTLNITSSTFSGNTAASGGSGGGVFINSPSMSNITGSTFSGNTAASGGGGGIFNAASSLLTVTSSTFNTNNTAISGGGIANGLSGQLTVTNSTLTGNSASSVGGGIVNGGVLNVINSTFNSNSATIYGGGIFNNGGGTLSIRSATLSGNLSATGGGIYNASALNYSNTIIANSTAGGDCVVAGIGAIGSNINNLVKDGSCSASLSGDPKLGPLASHGGSTQTFALLAGSPAINTGNDSECTNPPVNGLDQRGIARPQGAHCDIGSFELVDNTAPNTSIDSKTPATTPTNSTSITFTFSGTDIDSGVKSFECDRDGGGFTACTSPKSYTGLTQGAHTFQVRAIDYVGNVDASPASYTWTIDLTAPTVTMTSLASDPTSISPIAVTVQFSETVTGFNAGDILPGNGTVSNFVAVDGDTYTFNLTPSAQGLVTANIAAGMATDLAGNGNTAATQFTRTYIVVYKLFLPLILR
jgi:CSLREA domain-containing protein